MSQPAISKEYSEYNVNLVAVRLKGSTKSKPIWFEVLVDDVLVVQKTWDPSKFWGFQEQVDEDHTRLVTVRVYNGKSNNYQAYHFKLRRTGKEETLGAVESFNNRLDIQNLTHEHQLKEMRWENELKDVKRDKEILERKLEAREKAIEDLKAALKEEKKKAGQVDGLGEIIKFGAPLLKSYQTGQSPLPGLLGAVASSPSTPTNTPASSPSASPAPSSPWNSIAGLAEDLTEEETNKAIQITIHVVQNPEQLDDIIELLDI